MQVYDVTNAGSFKNVKNWACQIKNNASDSVKSVLLANKCDLPPEKMVRPAAVRAAAWHGRCGQAQGAGRGTEPVCAVARRSAIGSWWVPARGVAG